MENKTRKVRMTRAQYHAEQEPKPRKPYEPPKVEFVPILDFLNRTQFFTPVRILKSGPATVVFWIDGTKTVVRVPKDVTPNDYEAFCAALGKKIFGSNSALKKMIQRKTEFQYPKIKKLAAVMVAQDPGEDAEEPDSEYPDLFI